MATRNRPSFLKRALRGFLRQTYPNRELIVVDDSDRSMAPLCRDLPGVRYIRLTQPSRTGTKLNLGIEAARGDLLQKLDDDDWYGPTFLASSVEHFPRRGAASTLVTRCCFLVLLRGAGVLRHSGHGWNPGSAFCFHRSLWKRAHFRDTSYSVDSFLLRDLEPRIVRICRVEEHIVVRHGRNTWTRMTTGDANDYFRRCAAYPKPLDQLVAPEDLKSLAGMLGAPAGSRRASPTT